MTQFTKHKQIFEETPPEEIKSWQSAGTRLDRLNAGWDQAIGVAGAVSQIRDVICENHSTANGIENYVPNDITTLKQVDARDVFDCRGGWRVLGVWHERFKVRRYGYTTVQKRGETVI